MEYIKKILINTASLVALYFACGAAAAAQQLDTLVIPEGYTLADSVVTVPAPRVDSSLVGKDIFDIMPAKDAGCAADVKVHQSQLIRNYRIRIFFDNRQSARTDSEKMEKDFSAAHPDIPVYRSYVNPYFKVTVGDFRTKSEAMQLLRSIVKEYPTAFVVKENINYPAVDRTRPTVTDTVKVLRPAPDGQRTSL